MFNQIYLSKILKLWTFVVLVTACKSLEFKYNIYIKNHRIFILERKDERKI
jgi:hypothetical protein